MSSKKYLTIFLLLCCLCKTTVGQTSPKIITVRLNELQKYVYYTEDGEVAALKGEDIDLLLFGSGLDVPVTIKLTTAKIQSGLNCQDLDGGHTETETFVTTPLELTNGTSASLHISGDAIKFDDRPYYFCVLEPDNSSYIHQGYETHCSIDLFTLPLPVWASIVFIVILLALSGIFSGLNLGLMTLDNTELKIVMNTGNEDERRYAKKIAPIRKHGNYLLCTLLLGNVLVNSTLTTLLNSLTSGLVAVIGSTFLIVLLGEIIPQAICSRHGLAVGAHTLFLTKFFMLITLPISFPISKILDLVLGKEIGMVYDKKKLIEVLRMNDGNNDLGKDEVGIMTGALVYKDKKVRDVMTKLEDVFMLPLQAVLDFDTVGEIRNQGYSRIPIYDKSRKNIVHVLLGKDLMFIDPNDKLPLAGVCKYYSNEINFVSDETRLDIMFNEFKSGEKGHMAFVTQVLGGAEGKDEKDKDGEPRYETVGLITLEDVIEEIIQQEIFDETDVITDNITKMPRRNWQDKAQKFKRLNAVMHVSITPQIMVAVYQFLSSSIEPFKPPLLSNAVLKNLLTLNVYREVKMKRDMTNMSEEDEAKLILIERNKPIDFFILIIEGKVEARVGPEKLVFESGPFTHFGLPALMNLLTADGDDENQLTSIATINHVNSTNESIAAPAATTFVKQKKVSSIIAPPMWSLSGGASLVPDGSASRRASSSVWLKPGGSRRPSVAEMPSSRQGSLTGVGANEIVPLFVPDYTVKAITDVLYLRIRRATYLSAARASQLTRRHSTAAAQNSNDDTIHNSWEMKNLLETIAEDNNDSEPVIMMRTPTTSVRSLAVLEEREQQQQD